LTRFVVPEACLVPSAGRLIGQQNNPVAECPGAGQFQNKPSLQVLDREEGQNRNLSKYCYHTKPRRHEENLTAGRDIAINVIRLKTIRFRSSFPLMPL